MNEVSLELSVIYCWNGVLLFGYLGFWVVGFGMYLYFGFEVLFLFVEGVVW